MCLPNSRYNSLWETPDKNVCKLLILCFSLKAIHLFHSVIYENWKCQRNSSSLWFLHIFGKKTHEINYSSVNIFGAVRVIRFLLENVLETKFCANSDGQVIVKKWNWMEAMGKLRLLTKAWILYINVDEYVTY